MCSTSLGDGWAIRNLKFRIESNPNGAFLGQLQLDSATIPPALTKCRRHTVPHLCIQSGKYYDTVPQVLQPNVLVSAVLIVIVIDDRHPNHRDTVEYPKHIHRNTSTQARAFDYRRPKNIFNRRYNGARGG